MFGIGGTELLVILVVALIVLGPKSVPQIARTLGKAMGEFRKVSTEFQRTLNTEIELEEHEKRKQEAEKELFGTEQKAIWHNDGCSPTLGESVHNQYHKEIGCFARCEVGGEVLLDVGLLIASVGRIHQDDIVLILVRIIEYILDEGVIVHDGWGIDIVQEHIGDAENVGELLLLYPKDRLSVEGSILGRGHLLIEGFEPTGEESTSTTGEVGHPFAHLGLNHLGHKVGESAWGIKLS